MTITTSITVSNEERSLTEKHVFYDEHSIVLNKHCPHLQKIVAQATKNFQEGNNDPIDDIVLKFRVVW